MSIIYGIREVGSAEIRYVGLTNMPLKRKLANHLAKARTGWPYGPALWIAEGREVEIVRLRNCPASEARCAERRWVERLHNAGHRLFNRHLVPRETGRAA